MYDEDLIRELYPTTPLADLAEITGLSPFKLMMLANKWGLKREQKPVQPKRKAKHKLSKEAKRVMQEKREERKEREKFKRNIVANVDADVKFFFSRPWSGSEPHQPCTWFLGLPDV